MLAFLKEQSKKDDAKEALEKEERREAAAAERAEYFCLYLKKCVKK